MKQNEILEKLKNIENKLNDKAEAPLSFYQACDYLHFKPSYLYKLTSQKKIPFSKPTGKMLFFSVKELDQWIFGTYGKSGN